MDNIIVCLQDLTDLFANMENHVKCQGRWHLQAPQYKQKHHTK